ncbi:hypothetical protein CH63R_03108 [Colletotrichum higginsianum IMI 349063]|uniref:Uncharacterized protein n=1 Tax=Colletotrichum higginsianum (strain IMI 349063) TaxID=759273 RepID=A0A1B7YQZ6_COLHI|nr:hypothetical protein CH63R_03108 [Colletotrichum higginsianum IMI 349063]OBR14382.1 hypothetical protein CH63R_03108 [Colletotrichum higginsianum IMI 349063]
MNARAGLTCSRPIVLARRDSITMNTNHHRQPRRKRGPQFLTHCFLALVVMIGFGHGCEHNYEGLFSKSSNPIRTAGLIDTQKWKWFSLDV